MSTSSGRRPAIAGGRPVRDRFLVFGAPFIGEEEIAEVVDTLRSGWIGFGPKCIKLETEFAAYVGSAHALSLSSCTAGLHLALLACGVGPGDEVITTPLTFAATANMIELTGARPVFADVEAATQNIDPNRIESLLTPRTKAILPVHMAGRPCDMGAITEIAERRGISVIEDAAHAVEAAWDGLKIGSISRFTVFSFYATKNMTTAEGGMLTTADAEAAGHIRTLRLHGISQDAWKRYSSSGFVPYEIIQPGFKYNLTDLQASLGLHQLRRIEANLQVREQRWQAYDKGLAEVEGVETPPPARPRERHARHLYTIQLNLERLKLSRLEFVNALKAENVGTGIHFMPVHLQAFYRKKYGYTAGALPQAEAIGARTVSLPLSAGLSADDVADVVESVSKVANHFARRRRPS